MTFPPPSSCEPYWVHADWLPPGYILDHWCRQDSRCRHAKQQALLSACERGEIDYRRSDGKAFDDPIHELSSRGILLIDRDNFDAWAATVDGKSPLPARPRKQPPYPGWASPGDCRFNEERWEWVPVTPQDRSTPPAKIADIAPPRSETPSAGGLAGQTSGKIEVAISVDASPAEPSSVDVAVAADEKPITTPIPPKPNCASWAHLPTKSSAPSKSLTLATRTRNGGRNAWASLTCQQIARRCTRSEGLQNRGAERYPSWWRPDLVAKWLIERRHLPNYKVAPILRKEFPVWTKLFDEQ
jgi:hypothetical protein